MKPSVIVAVMLAIGIYLASRCEAQNSPRSGAKKTTQKTSTSAPGTVPNEVNNYWVWAEAQPRKDQSPHWYESSEWLLVMVGCITFIVIGWQSFETRRAADAAKLSAVAAEKGTTVLIDSERAWVIGEIGALPDGFTPPTDPNNLEMLWVFPNITNYGKTPARLTRIAAAVRLVPDGEQLPAEPRYATGLDESIDSVLPPMVPFLPRVGISSIDMIQAREQGGTLYVYGLIEYIDIGKTPRRSAYCFFFAEQGGYSPNKTGFYPAFEVPRAYTECT